MIDVAVTLSATTTLLLNYRKDGTAFYNLLVRISSVHTHHWGCAKLTFFQQALIPLRDANGELQYFIGGRELFNHPLEIWLARSNQILPQRST